MGDRMVFTATDGSLWKIDYPTLEALEQLTPALPNVTQVNWSPDGNSIAFISGSDIYIVDTIK
jgi:tricorn protease-like protein